MTIETFQQPGAVVAPSVSGAAVESIVRWASNLSTAAQAMRLIVDTPFMPQSFWPLPKGVTLRDWPTPHLQHPRESVEEFAARREVCVSSGAIAVVKGDEVGLGPQAALESIYVVRGKPGMYAETMEALVRAHGHKVERLELTERRCRIRTQRSGETTWQEFEFSIERAKKAGYDRQNPKYGTDPQSMLWARCRSEAARGTAPEVLKGLQSVEEIEDETDGDGAARPTRTVQRTARAVAAAPAAALPAPQAPSAPVAQAQPAAPAQAAPAASAAPFDDGYDTAMGGAASQQPAAAARPMMDKRQWDAINERFAELGVRGDGQKAYRAAVIRRIVGDPNLGMDAVSAEAAQLVLDNLAGDPGARMVARILTEDGAPAHLIPVLAEPEAPAAEAVEADPADEIDPTMGDDWPMDGAEAAAEGL